MMDNEFAIIQLANGNKITFSLSEWKFFIKYVVEDCLEFHAGVLNEFGELAPDFPEEFNYQDNKNNFKNNRSVFTKLRELGIDTKGL